MNHYSQYLIISEKILFMKYPLIIAFFLIFSFPSIGQQIDLDYYLKGNYTYAEHVPKPKSVLGFEVGEWHASHDQVVRYYQTLAAQSDRAEIIEYGYTYEHRPLIMLAIMEHITVTYQETQTATA